MNNTRPLIPDCVDVDHTLEILTIYQNGEEKRAVQMVREHLSYCAACFKQFHCVSVIEEVVTGKKPDDIYLEFIEVVNRIGRNKKIEKYELQELYVDFLSGKCLGMDKGYSEEEYEVVGDFYDKLNELIDGEGKTDVNYKKSHFFNWGAVAAIITISVLTVGVLNSSKLKSINSKAFDQAISFPTYSEQTAYTPTRSKLISADDAQKSFPAVKFGLPVDQELREVYFNPVRTEKNTLFTVSMNY